MKISSRQYAQGLFEVVNAQNDQEELKKLVNNFGLILRRQHDLGNLNEIIDNFQEIWDREHGELSVEVLTARQLESVGKELIISYLQEQTKMSKINLEEKVEENLQGGFVLKYNSRIIDGSLQNNLRKLKNKIIN